MPRGIRRPLVHIHLPAGLFLDWTGGASTAARACTWGFEHAVKLPDNEKGRQADDESHKDRFHDVSFQYPSHDPIWKRAAANKKANVVLKRMEKAPHFQDPASREMDMTVMKHGA